MVDPEDAAREIDKLVDVLEVVSKHLHAAAAANAALHMAEVVRPTPLAVAVEGAIDNGRRAAERFRA